MRGMLIPAALLGLAVPAPPPAVAASLRPMTVLAAGVVKLSDLFDGAPDAARVLGPAPAPGNRIVVEAPQLAAIARQFGVDWRPDSAADRSVLDRPGRALLREDVVAAIRQALDGLGAAPDGEIEIPAFAPPMVAAGETVRPTVEQLDYDAATGRFSALLAVGDDGVAPVQLRLAGRVLEMMEVPVATRRIAAGAVIGPGDLRIARLRASAARGELAQTLAQAEGMAVRHQIAPGQPVPVTELSRPPLVTKGAVVTMLLDSGALSLSAQGQALEAGAAGDTIRVANPVSRAVVEAAVIAPGRVRILPGSAPLPPAVASRLLATVR